MILYHFTSRYHIEGCLKQGLRIGAIPISIDPPKLCMGYQWLTKSGAFNQEWCRYSSLPYKRNDYRIKIKIKKPCNKLVRWLPFCEKYEFNQVLNSHGDPHNWYLWKGFLSPKMFKKVTENNENFIDSIR